jgi:anti-sigma B factor antagonist
MRSSSREKTRGISLMFLLTGHSAGADPGSDLIGQLDRGAAMAQPSSFEHDPAVPAPDSRAAAAQPAVPDQGSRQQHLVLVITLPGEIDVTNSGEVGHMLAGGLAGGAAVVVADASGTSFCGCDGATVLKRAHRQATAAGVQLRVVASPALRRVIGLTGADQVLDMYPSLATALRWACPGLLLRQQDSVRWA